MKQQNKQFTKVPNIFYETNSHKHSTNSDNLVCIKVSQIKYWTNQWSLENKKDKLDFAECMIEDLRNGLEPVDDDYWNQENVDARFKASNNIKRDYNVSNKGGK